MKLGIGIQHYDARNDIRDLVDLLAARCEVVLFARPGEVGRFKPAQEVRYIQGAHRSRMWLWQQLFRFFGTLPRSVDNFFICEVFKLASIRGPARFRALAALRCRLAGPRFFQVSQFLARLADCDQTPIDDVDAFFFITEFNHFAFLAHALNSGKPVSAYVYSWDHPCKHPVMPREVHKYLVWNGELARDMWDLQGVPESRCTVIGATQLGYVKSYLESPELRKRQVHEPYFYFGCGVGNLQFALQEARVVECVARALAERMPRHLLLVRPYPMFARSDFFDPLRSMPNVAFDDSFTRGRSDRSLTLEDIYRRLSLQEHADAFLHLGTTMGLEGAYLDTPVLFLDLRDFDYGVPESDHYHLRKFIHQYHNDRYMILDGYPNVIQTVCDLPDILQRAVEERSVFLEYNRAISNVTSLRSLDEIAEDIIQNIEKMSSISE